MKRGIHESEKQSLLLYCVSDMPGDECRIDPCDASHFTFRRISSLFELNFRGISYSSQSPSFCLAGEKEMRSKMR